AEYLGKEGNALLKILEEPPEQTVFILVAENQDLILNTILSRTQIVKIGSIENNALVNYLVETQEVDRTQAAQVANLSGGNLSEAIQMLADEATNSALLFMEWMQMYSVSDIISKPDKLLQLNKWIDTFNGVGRENQKQALTYALHFFENLLHFQINNNTELFQAEELIFAKAVAA